MSKYRVAVQMYTVNQFLKTPAEVRSTLAKFRKAGYDAAQICAVCPMPPKELRDMMLGEGIDPIGAHTDMNALRSNLKGVIAECHGWGVAYNAISWLPMAEYKTPEAQKKLFKEIEGYAKILKKEGITLQYHNHAFEFERFGIKNGRGGKLFLDMLYESTKLLQAELDFGWVLRGGGDPVAWAAKMKGRLDQVHFKDWGIANDQMIFREVGEGSVNWPAVIKACKAAGTRHFIVEQDACPVTNDPFKSIAISRANLTKMGL
ncbi:MAG: sugar phosphate isomerase/epimerase [Kiritimatiellaeota bacterium]|nr:sugar phosphate isomerase/epimerase [Kiritimatiellota bacterium]